MKKGLFINNKQAKDSIFESGYMVYQSLLNSTFYTLDYQEIDVDNRQVKTGYDFYIFNYHPFTMAWLDTKTLKKNLGFVVTIILEVAPNDPFVMCPEKDFHLYCALDPTMFSKQKNVHAFPRPLEKVSFNLPEVHNLIPVIGSFGFATKGKGFHHVVEAVNKEFDRAIVRINIPFGDFVPESDKYAAHLGEICRKAAKPGIEVKITHDFMTKEELIKWCAGNTLNCFLYDRDMPGLSATTDQAIVTGKPLSVSENNTFRHITSYLPPYPVFSLKDSINKSIPIVHLIKQDWQPEKFREKFENLIQQYAIDMTSKIVDNGCYNLALAKNSLLDIVRKRIKKYKWKFKNMSVKKVFTTKGVNEII